MKFLAFIQAIDEAEPKEEKPQIETRRQRRKRARDTAQAAKEKPLAS